MGTRTYSRRASDGTRKLTALGRRRQGRVSQPLDPALTAPNGALYDAFQKGTEELNPSTVVRVNSDLTQGLTPYKNDADMRLANRALLQQVYEEQGYNGKPTVVSPEELGTMLAEGDVLTINGVPFVGVRAVSTERNLDDLFEGDTHHVPRQAGYFGSGTYFAYPIGYNTPDQLYLLRSSSSYRLDAFMVTRSILGRVTSGYGDRSTEYKGTAPDASDDLTWYNEKYNRIPAAMATAFRADTRTNFEEMKQTVDNLGYQVLDYRGWAQDLAQRFQQRFGRVSADIGTMAAMMGYDAIVIPTVGMRMSDNEILVLNRSKLIVTELSRATHTMGGGGINEMHVGAQETIKRVGKNWTKRNQFADIPFVV